MGIFDYIKSAFNRLFGNVPISRYDDSAIINVAQSFPNSMGENSRSLIKSIVDEIHQVYTTANNKEFTIGIIGDFTVGKSSFVNAILGDRIAPVSANPCTAIITKIKYSRKPKVVVHYNDNREVEMSYEDFLTFSAFNIDDFRERNETKEILRFKDIADATIFVNSDFLKANNLCIVDTLGLSAHESDNKKTIASIKDAIAIIYICDERGLSDKDVEFISTYLNIEESDFFFCINRIDLVKKSEREGITKLVKLKLDDILQKAGFESQFPLSRIYQVSSLYQNFANGFIDHEEWREDIDYQSRSGFLPIMNDIGKYVKDNVTDARKRAINKQLETARAQVKSLISYRETEISILITKERTKIESINSDIKRFKDKVAYTNSLFENLEQTIYSLLSCLFSQYSKNVSKRWDYISTFDLMDKVSFGFGDYMKLEKDILALKLNVFKTMSDSRYAKLDSLTPIINETFQYLQDTLQPILADLSSQIKALIATFVKQNSLQKFFNRQKIEINIQDFWSTQPDIRNAMYRAVAQAAVESTWVKNNTRKLKMLNAAKDEALKVMEKPFKDYTDQLFSDIQNQSKECNDLATQSDITSTNNLNNEKKKIENNISLTEQQWDDELKYYKNFIHTVDTCQISE